MARTRNEANAAARRIQILDAAAECFVRHGIHQTTMREIIAAAGLSAGAVYNYFESKKSIILAIAEREREEIATLADFLTTAPDTRRAIVQAVQAIIAECTANEARLSVEVLAEASRNDAVSAAARENDRALREAFHEAIVRGQEAGDIDTALSATQLLEAIVAVYGGFIGGLALDATASGIEHAATAALIVERFLNPNSHRQKT